MVGNVALFMSATSAMRRGKSPRSSEPGEFLQSCIKAKIEQIKVDFFSLRNKFTHASSMNPLV